MLNCAVSALALLLAVLITIAAMWTGPTLTHHVWAMVMLGVAGYLFGVELGEMTAGDDAP